MIRKLLLCLGVLSMQVSLLAESGKWTTHSPGTLKSWELEKAVGPSGKPIRKISFIPRPENNDYWCNSGLEFETPMDADQIKFFIRAYSDIKINLKIIDSEGKDSYRLVSTGKDWTEAKLACPLELKDIKKLQFIFHGTFSKEKVSFLISDVNFLKLNEQEEVSRCWTPPVIPPPVKGYRIETTINNCWRIKGGDYNGVKNAKGCKMVYDIAMKLQKHYGNVSIVLANATEIYDENLLKRLNKAGIIVGVEGHNTPSKEFMEKNKSYAINVRGERYPDFLWFHSADKTNPLNLKYVQENSIIPVAKNGANTWRSVDYTWQSHGGPIWGYSKSAIKRWKEDLNGTDCGLEIEDNGKTRIVKFHEYLESYTGGKARPEDFGISTWDEYEPPAKDEANSEVRRNKQKLFAFLFHYEWVKFINEANRPGYKYGLKGQPTVNPESHFNGTDLYWLMKLKYVKGFCDEWWNNANVIVPVYYNGIYYDNIAAKNKKEIIHLGESGAAGNGFGVQPNYWDNMANYLITYSKSASVDAKAMNDQYWATSWERMTDPNNKEIYEMYTAYRCAWSAFLQAHNDKAVKPKAKILAITNRPITRNSNPLDVGVDQPHNIARSLIQKNFLLDGAAFPLHDAYSLKDYNTIVFSPYEHPEGFIEKLGNWLNGKNGRTLITHSTLPTGKNLVFESEREISPKEKLLGIDEISSTKIRKGEIKSHDKAFDEVLKPFMGKNIKFSNYIYKADGGKVLVSLSGNPLVSEFKSGKGRVIYLHFTPEDNGIFSRGFEEAVMSGIMNYLDYAPIAVTPASHRVLLFDKADGGWTAIIINLEANLKVKRNGKVYRIYQALAPEEKGSVKINVRTASSEFVLTDMITGKKESVTSDDKGFITVKYDGWNMRGLYIKKK